MRYRFCLLVLVNAAILMSSSTGIAQGKPADRLVLPIIAAQRTITNPVPALAKKQNNAGATSRSQVFHRMILLLKRSSAQQARLEKLLQKQQDPGSPLYHRWLTPTQFGQQFGPSANDMAKIAGWLRTQGFSVAKPPPGRQFLTFTGTSAQVEAAFQTQIDRYRIKNKTYFANATPASIPTALTPDVSGVASLSSFTKLTPEYHLKPNPQIQINDFPLTAPADLSAIYDATPLKNANVLGQGQSIALIEESNITVQDVTDFRKIAGLPAATVNVIVNGPNPGLVSGEETEAIADVEYAGALAPDATLNVIVTASTDLTPGIALSMAYAVDHDVSPITSLSYGGCETLDNTFSPNVVALFKSLYEQGAAEGISQFVASGDYGGDACGGTGLSAGYGVNAIGDSPWNVSVGGTEFIMPDPNVYFPSPSYTATGYIPESAWNDYENPQDGRPLAGGGGVSINFKKPAWQTGPGVPGDGARDVPDVSLVAGDNLAYMVCESDQGGNCAQGYAIGLIGTSLATPVWAGIQALVNQKNDEAGGAGNPDPVYYQLAAGSNSPFHDITVGDTKVPDDCVLNFIIYCPGGSTDLVGYETTSGYDLATGLGSVDVNKLVTNWTPTTGSGTATVTLSTGGVTSITHGDAVTATVTVTGAGSTTPTGDVVLMAGSQGVDRITLGTGGTATLTFGTSSGVELPGGSYNLVAHYAGDTNFAPANSNAVAITVSPEPTTTTVSSSATSAVPYGTPVTFNAAAYGNNSGTGYPVPGTYTFTDGTTTLGTATLVGTGAGQAFATAGATASLLCCSTGVLSAGTHQIVASSPAASASFQASTSSSTTVVVDKSQVLVELTPTYTNPAVNTPVNLAAGVRPLYEANNSLYGVFAPVTGNVDFYDTSTTPETKLGTVALSGDTATLPVTFTSTGLHTVVAQYDGDANDIANTSGAVDITVGTKAPTAITINGGSGWTYTPSPITLRATLTAGSAGATPTGTVTFIDSTANNGAGESIGTATLGANGIAQLSISTLSPGTHAITATYPGDANFAGSASQATKISIIAMTLTPGSSTTTVTAGQSTAAIPIKFSTNPVSTNYYYSSVKLTCSGLPAGATCVFTPATFFPSDNPSTEVLSGASSLTIDTNGPILQQAKNTPPATPWGGVGTLALAGLLGFGLFRRRRLFASLSMLLLLVFFLGLGGCGSGGKYNITSPGTTAGTYTVTITGTMAVFPFGTYKTTTKLNLTVTAPGK